jgi:hypothetical protein
MHLSYRTLTDKVILRRLGLNRASMPSYGALHLELTF